MFATFGMEEGKMLFGHHEASDFGSTVSIMESFARGNNFPTQFPHFTGDRMRYHFLFYFQAGNLQYLGLSPAFGNNILSILSLVAMLILVMTLGAVVFGSRVAGRIGAALFFFHGSLAYMPYVASIGSVWGVVSKLLEVDLLPTGFPYRGETWGIWTQIVFVNQRHLASSIGLFLLVLVFLFIRYRVAEDRARALRISIDLKREEEANKIVESTESENTSAEEPNALADIEPDGEVGLVNDAADSEVLKPAEGSETPIESETGTAGLISDPPESLDHEIPVPAEGSASVADNEPDDAVAPIDDPHVSHDNEIPASTDEQIFAEEGETEKEVASTSYQDRGPYFDAGEAGDISEVEKQVEEIKPRKTFGDWLSEGMVGVIPFVFCGILLGLMPMWNGAVFTAAFAVLAMLFLLFPLRRQMVLMGIAAGLVALPQVYFLDWRHGRSGLLASSLGIYSRP